MAPKLPGLNYATPLTINDLDHLEAVYTDEFIRRMLAIIGSYRTSGASFGIFSESDPIGAVSTDPWFITQNETDGMTVDVEAGAGLTESGMLVFTTSKIMQLPMVNIEVGQQNVVFVEYLTVPDEETIVKTRFNTSEARQNIRALDITDDPTVLRTVQVASSQDWTNNTLFPPERRANIIPLALVTISSKTASPYKEVTIDLSRQSLTTNRPWFSPVDMQHRAQVGTGAATVPHQLGLNDLAQGDLTLYDQLLNYGMVLGRDRDAPGVPGAVCIETVTPTRVETDVNGSVTGTISQLFVRLTRYPVRLLGAYSITDPTNDILVELIPHTNILTVSLKEYVPSQGFRVQYTTVAAGEPLTDSLVDGEVHFLQPIVSREMVISGGKGYTVIGPKFTDLFGNEKAKISLSTSAAIPKRYRIYVDSSGQLMYGPQHILCSTRLDDIGTSAYNFNVTLLGSARIRIGLTSVLPGFTTVVLRITGTDANGNTVTEDLTFTPTNYEAPDVGTCEENPKNFQITDTVFTSVQNLLMIQRVSDGPNTTVMVYADLDPMMTDALRTVCPLAEVMWNGEGICRIRDIRPISSRLEVPTKTNIIESTTQAILATLTQQGVINAVELLGEDLRDPYKLKVSDPLRYFKFADGLRSSIMPEQPGVESMGERIDQDIYVSQALRLIDGVSRCVHVALLGRDTKTYWLNNQDGIIPTVEARWALSATPDQWTDWAVASSTYFDGSNFKILVTDDTAIKIQLRVKGSVVGVVAIQYLESAGFGLQTQDAAWHDLYTVFVDEKKSISLINCFVQAFRNNSQQAALYLIRLLARRAVGGNVTIVGSPTIAATEDDPAWNVQFVADTANQMIRLQVMGASGTTIQWKAIINESWLSNP